jgi:hypothetical protein
MRSDDYGASARRKIAGRRAAACNGAVQPVVDDQLLPIRTLKPTSRSEDQGRRRCRPRKEGRSAPLRPTSSIRRADKAEKGAFRTSFHRSRQGDRRAQEDDRDMAAKPATADQLTPEGAGLGSGALSFNHDRHYAPNAKRPVAGFTTDPRICQPDARLYGWLLVQAAAWSWGPSEMFRATALVTDWRNMAEFGQAFLHPNFHDWDLYVADMVVTIQIAVWGTALAVLFGIPFSILCPANICPAWIVQPVRH